MDMSHGAAEPPVPESLLRVQVVGPDDGYCARVQDVQVRGREWAGVGGSGRAEGRGWARASAARCGCGCRLGDPAARGPGGACGLGAHWGRTCAWGVSSPTAKPAVCRMPYS